MKQNKVKDKSSRSSNEEADSKAGHSIQSVTLQNDGLVTAENLEPDQKMRLWEHGMHEDKLFHDRLNFFTVLESALLGIGGVLYNKQPDAAKNFLFVLVGLGLALTMVWLFIQFRHFYYLNFIVERLKTNLPEFKQTVDEFSQNKPWHKFSVTRLLALSIPTLFAIVWLIAFFYLYNSA